MKQWYALYVSLYSYGSNNWMWKNHNLWLVWLTFETEWTSYLIDKYKVTGRDGEMGKQGEN